MRLRKMLSLFGCAAICLCGSVRGAAPNDQEWITRLKEIFRDNEPYVPEKDPGIVKETKYPGEIYTHFFKSDITGIGRAVTERSISWFNSEKSMRFHHQANVIIIEEIVSTESELAAGVVKSKFTVQRFDETFASLKGKMEIGPIGSERLVKALMYLGKQYGAKLKISGVSLIAVGLGVVKMPLPEMTHKIGAAGTVALGAALWAIGWVTADVLPKEFDESGYKKLSPDYVKKVFPAYREVVARTRHLEGSTAEAEWQVKKGYTSVKIRPADPQITEDDCRVLAKMIYRMNPVGSRKVLPKGYENKKFWRFKAEDIGGMITVAGADFDTLRGTVTVRNNGKSVKKYPDEQDLKRPKVPVAMLETAEQFGNKIFFVKKFQDGSSLKLSAVPVFKIEMIVDDDRPGAAPVYVRNVSISDSTLEGRMDKNSSGFWEHVAYEESSLKFTCEYNQLRERPLKK